MAVGDDSIAAIHTRSTALADFRANPRLLILAVMALVVGTGGTFAMWLLVKLAGAWRVGGRRR